jgi:hypothetical protein
MNEHVVKAVALIGLAVVALALIFTHQVQYLPAVGSAAAIAIFLL